jgi:hypothetical protein
VLPVEPEAEEMPSFLPRQVLGDLVAASNDRKRSRIAEHEPRIRNIDARGPEAETPGTVIGTTRSLRGVEKEIRESEIIDDRRGQRARERGERLVRSILRTGPAGRKDIGSVVE